MIARRSPKIYQKYRQKDTNKKKTLKIYQTDTKHISNRYQTNHQKYHKTIQKI